MSFYAAIMEQAQRSYIKAASAASLKAQMRAIYSANGDWKFLARENNINLRATYRWINATHQMTKREVGRESRDQ